MRCTSCGIALSRSPVLAACALALVTASYASAQNVPADTSLSVRTALYESNRTIPLLAVGLEYLLTPVGHAYAGNWKRGIPPAVVLYGGVALLAKTALDCLDDDCEGNDPALIAGLVATTGGKLWALVSAYDTARDSNRALRRRLRLGVRPIDGAWEVRVAF